MDALESEVVLLVLRLVVLLREKRCRFLALLQQAAAVQLVLRRGRLQALHEAGLLRLMLQLKQLVLLHQQLVLVHAGAQVPLEETDFGLKLLCL